jgi:hypothetical protein
MDLSQQTKPYPRYLYHRDFNEPKIVNSKVEEVELGTKGWTTARLFKEYPKWVGDTIVRSEAEEKRLLAANALEEPPSPDVMFDEGLSVSARDPLAVKEIQVDGQDTATVEKLKKPVGRPKKT